ncbi:MAG TPA: serine hydrolase, partial [Ferruginibacter sp.]|nr:serine hydrolase [Ferruginibacter sp.]
FPLRIPENPTAKDIAYVSIGVSDDNAFAKRIRNDYNADVFYFDYKQDASRLLSLVPLIKRKYGKVIIGIHNYNRVPANNFGISKAAVDLVSQLQQQTNAVTFVFGNPYAIRNWCDAKNLIACYEDEEITQNTAIDLLQGKINARGHLPVTVCPEFKFGTGIVSADFFLPRVSPIEAGFDPVKMQSLDSIANDAIARGATPGCVLLVAKNGKIVYHKAYGSYTYDRTTPVSPETVYDMASVTKICATTLSIMKLYDQGKISLDKTLGDYLPWVRGTNKEQLTIENVLLHQAGLAAYIPFYKEIIDHNGLPISNYYSAQPRDSFTTRVAENFYLRNDWKDTMIARILSSPLGPPNKYVYSDNDFIFLGKIVEAISGMPLNEYVAKEFYIPLCLSSAGFKPRERLPV